MFNSSGVSVNMSSGTFPMRQHTSHLQITRWPNPKQTRPTCSLNLLVFPLIPTLALYMLLSQAHSIQLLARKEFIQSLLAEPIKVVTESSRLARNTGFHYNMSPSRSAKFLPRQIWETLISTSFAHKSSMSKPMSAKWMAWLTGRLWCRTDDQEL